QSRVAEFAVAAFSAAAAATALPEPAHCARGLFVCGMRGIAFLLALSISLGLTCRLHRSSYEASSKQFTPTCNSWCQRDQAHAHTWGGWGEPAARPLGS